MDLNAGYKRTEVGVIPDDWSLAPLRDLIIEFRGGAPLKPSDFKKTGVKVLPKRAVGRTGWLNLEDADIQYCSPEYAKKYWRNQVDQTFTIVVLRDLVPSGPNIGLMVQIKDRDRFILAQGVYGFKVNSHAVPRYLVQASNTRWYRKMANSIMVGSTQVHITNSAFRGVQIPLPPYAEQEAIADRLSVADALIESLEQLLAKRRDLKQGAMQELLTGKRRLPGFSGEWEVKTLGDLFNFSGGFTASRDQLTSNGYCYLHYGDIHVSNKFFIDVRGDYQDIPKLDIPLKKVSPSSLLSDGDVVFVDASEDDEGTSKHMVIINPEGIPFISGLHTIVAKGKTDSLQPLYRRYCFQTKTIQAQFRFFAVGTKVSGISKSNIARINLPVPSVTEQSAIATILSDMDAGIGGLEAKLAKTRHLKQGMMQELLTGRIRLT